MQTLSRRKRTIGATAVIALASLLLFLLACGDSHMPATAAAAPVSAKFAFVEKLPNGIAYSVTPILGTLGADGKFTTMNINDPATGQPVDAQMQDVFLSSDGKKLVFTLFTSDSSGNYTTNIYTANSDYTGIMQLTHNVPTSSFYSSQDWAAQFSKDTKQIVYIHTYAKVNQVWAMNADGTNQHLVFDSQNYWAAFPSFSPDGTQIVAEVAQMIGNTFYDGIATMNSDGTNVVQLTGVEDRVNCAGSNDTTPTFTNDGKQISFVKHCWFYSGLVAETVYIMKTDGTSITKLHGDNQTIISSQPRAVADRLVFSTNVDYPVTDLFEMYSIMPDGSNLTRITNNMVYDGSSTLWMFPTGMSSLLERNEHLRMPQGRGYTH